mmetsp:Transcript_3152/g.7104  ORF Transcript_3152/g.7104 Transcript_3152/m.7104 type:complete len:516 (-) Transcript_3152:75-1622(-)
MARVSLLVTALLYPSLASCRFLRYQSISSAGDADIQDRAISGIVIAEGKDGAEACAALGSSWSFAGPSAMASPLLASSPTSWLCVERSTDSETVVTDVGFAVVPAVAQSDDDASKVTALSQQQTRTNITSRVSFAATASNGCESLGSAFLAVKGQIVPLSADKQHIHLCMESAIRSKVSKDDMITKLEPYTLDTARATSCSRHITAKGSHQHVLLEVPGMDIESLYDNPLMLCIARQRHQRDSDLHVMEAERKIRVAENESTVMFPEYAFQVGLDMGNRSRKHVFVIGPETSGTRLWATVMRSGYGLTGDKVEWVYNNKAAVFHLSLPWGSMCGATDYVPNYVDFGGTYSAYAKVQQKTEDVATASHAVRFNVDPLQVVEAHSKRGDSVTVLLVARDPRASFAGKMGNHCFKEDLGKKEQSEAFQLMVKAARAGNPNVHVICYEDMLEQGYPYLVKKMGDMGTHPGDVPSIQNGNTKYDLDDFDCEGDILLYGELCPSSSLGKSIKKKCSVSESK